MSAKKFIDEEEEYYNNIDDDDDESYDDDDDREKTLIEKKVNNSDIETGKSLYLLIIGQSKSGKSTFAKSIISKYCDEKREVVVLNDKTKSRNFKKIDWKDLKLLSNTALIVEDIISCTADQTVQLRTVLDFKGHHHNIWPIIFITHKLWGTNVYGLLSSFKYICLSAKPSSYKALRDITRSIGMEDDERNNCLKLLKEGYKENFNYIWLDVDNRNFKLVKLPNPNEKACKRKLEKLEESNAKISVLKARADEYFSLLGEKKITP